MENNQSGNEFFFPLYLKIRFYFLLPMMQVNKKIVKEINKSSNAIGMVHICAQSIFLPFLYLTWYTTDIALLEPEAQLHQHLRKSSKYFFDLFTF